MGTCYASHLGGCDRISGEHVVPANLFAGETKVTVRGLPFIKVGTVGISSLKANVLCRNHNSLLSELDDEVGKLGKAIQNIKSKKGDVEIQLDGRRLERFLLKNAVGAIAGGWRGAKIYPGRDVIDGLFGLIPLPDNVALYGLSNVARLEFNPGGFAATWIQSPSETEEFGLLISVHDFPLLLSICLSNPQDALRNTSAYDKLDLRMVVCEKRPDQLTLTVTGLGGDTWKLTALLAW